MHAYDPWRKVLAVWAAASAVSAVASLPGSYAFSVRQVAVSGAQTVPVAALLEASGVVPGVPLATVNPQALRRQLLRHPRVRDAQVEVRWPDAVRVRVWERTPFSVLRLADGAQALLDAQAVVLQRSGKPQELPVILHPSVPWLQPGSRVPAEEVVRVVEELASLPEAERHWVAWVRWLPTGDLVVGTREGFAVRCPVGQLLRGLRTARAVVRTLRARGVQPAVVDLRFGRWAVVQPAP
ncbi:MAG: hypothetical protein C4303_08705 [candidate division GAL15 bacterium]